jgi:tetratricopeptide (TPR) repeat protein
MTKLPEPEILLESNRRVFEQGLHDLNSGQPARAADACKRALAEAPDDVDFLTLLGAALIAQKEPKQAVEPLQRAVQAAPRFARARENLGHALMMLGKPDEALAHLQQAAKFDQNSVPVRLKLAHALASLGQGEEADAMFEEAFALDPNRGKLAHAGELLREGRLEECKETCQGVLALSPDDVNAMRILAKVAGEKGHWRQSERLLLRALEIAPAFNDLRIDLARVYKQQDRLDDAVASATAAVAHSPRTPNAHYMHASMLALTGAHENALEAYRKSISISEYHPAAWVGMGHLLKTLGRQSEGVEAYRKAIEQRPNFGEVYWSLANLKTFRFTPEEVSDIERRLAEEDLDADARTHFLFTLGKAKEDAGDYSRAFECYAQACELHRPRIYYDPVETRVINDRIREVFTADFLDTNSGKGCQDPAPIFIVGMPRSGSTLIEQILASHSQVEGTAELPDVGRVIGIISARSPEENYPEAAAWLKADDWRELGEEYLRRTMRHRSGLPYFTDKMPNNFPSVGLIHLMLPNAKIIDARRHPLDSCFGCFKQHFAHGQTFSYDLMEIAEYYREYRKMMRHWHGVLPGKVLEVRYEDMVRDQEGQTRRLLEYCGLPFEDGCLRFYETDRPVRTASSEQVRMPIYESSLDHWRHFREELAPLIEALGDELDGAEI